MYFDSGVTVTIDLATHPSLETSWQKCQLNLIEFLSAGVSTQIYCIVMIY